MTRNKSAIIAIIFLATAIVAAVSLDYTDTYVADRFYRALDSPRYEPDKPFSLDAFLEYYDWDAVCICPSATSCPELKTRFGLPYTPNADGEKTWSLVFVKSYYVVAEIPVRHDVLQGPEDRANASFERWTAIVKITDEGGAKRLSFVAD